MPVNYHLFPIIPNYGFSLALLIVWILSNKSMAEYIEGKLLGASRYVYCLLPVVKQMDKDQ